MKTCLGRISFVLLALGLLALAAPSPACAQATTTTTHLDIPFDVAQPVPCLNGGAGDTVVISGTVHAVITTTIDAQGGVHMEALFYPGNDVTGVAMTTGTIYNGNGVTHQGANTKVGSTTNLANNFYFIAPGPGNNFYFHDTIQVTINANGTITANVANSFATCH
jgi:hypothetical protein